MVSKYSLDQWDTLQGNRSLLVLLLLCLFFVPDTECQRNFLKGTNSRAGSSKFSLNPFKPLLNLVRDPLRASAQRNRPKFIPPPPNMYHNMAAPSRVSNSISSMHHSGFRLMGSPSTRLYPQSSITVLPPITASSSMLMSALAAGVDKSYRPYSSSVAAHPSDIQVKTLRLPSRHKRPSTSSIADSVVRQLLDMPSSDNYPSVLVIEDPDLGSQGTSSSAADLFSDQLSSVKSQPTIVVAPSSSLGTGDLSDSSTDLSMSSTNAGLNNNQDVFVIVSKNPKQKLFAEDKKGQDINASASNKVKKYKISTSLDDISNPSSRQVWIIKR